MPTKFFIACIAAVAAASEPNPPIWDQSKVFVIEAGDSSAQASIDAALANNGGHIPPDNGQWSDARYAFLFKPGDHSSINMEVGYYTTVHGLGRTPPNTILGNLMVQNGDFNYEIGALNNFWRSAENVMVTPAAGSPLLWAVSQASPLRRIQVNGDLQLFQYNYGCCAGYASGGYMADMYITGNVAPGSQQQWFTRNAQMGTSQSTVWNGVWVGCEGAPSDHCGNNGGSPNTTISSTPYVMEKPYIIYDQNSYKLMVPRLEQNKVGYTPNWENAEEIDFSQVYVAFHYNTASQINAKLAQGLNLVLQPGIYYLEDSIKVVNNNTVIFGMGLATLIPINGTACIEVGNYEGVRISGVLLEAAPAGSDVLLKFGDSGYAGNSANPGLLADIFARSGRFYSTSQAHTSANKFVQVNTGHTIIDDVWLWRGDHDYWGSVMDSQNPVQNGLEVNGDNVYGYGLACEHTLADMLAWNGENGHSYFYQSEYPYDVTQANYGDKGYAAYKVASNVTQHEGYGIGAYSYFRDNYVSVNSGIVCPETSGVKFSNSLTVFLNGYGEIKHVVNNSGSTSSSGNTPNYWCSYQETANYFLQ